CSQVSENGTQANCLNPAERPLFVRPGALPESQVRLGQLKLDFWAPIPQNHIMKAQILGALLGLIAGPVLANPFNAAPSFPAGGTPDAVALADFNGDGALDFAVANELGTGVVTLSLGDGHGNFSSGGTLLTGTIFVVAITTADLNGDG